MVSLSNRKRGRLKTYRGSDQLIVLRGRESRPHGEGVDGNMQPAKETLARQAGLGQIMPTSLQAIAQKAKRLKDYRFRNLYRLLNQHNLKTAWKHINKRAASGTDKMTAREFVQNLDNNVAQIAESLKNKQYRAKLVRRVHIPKDNKGKTRPLGIPAIADKLVQSCAARILDAIYEQDFIPNSYGYRPKVGAQTAIKDLTQLLWINWQLQESKPILSDSQKGPI